MDGVFPDNLVTELSAGPSFFNRYKQLDQQERERKQLAVQKEIEEKEEELVVVSRPQKKIKKKKKKKKKEPAEDSESAPTNEDLTDSLKDTQSMPTQSDTPSAEPIKLAEPVQPVKDEQLLLYDGLLTAGEGEESNKNDNYNREEQLDPFLPIGDDGSHLMSHDDPLMSHDDPLMSHDNDAIPRDIVRSRSDAINSNNSFDDFIDKATPTKTTPNETTRTVATPTFNTEDVSQVSPKVKLSIPEATPNLSKFL